MKESFNLNMAFKKGPRTVENSTYISERTNKWICIIEICWNDQILTINLHEKSTKFFIVRKTPRHNRYKYFTSKQKPSHDKGGLEECKNWFSNNTSCDIVGVWLLSHVRQTLMSSSTCSRTGFEFAMPHAEIVQPRLSHSALDSL